MTGLDAWRGRSRRARWRRFRARKVLAAVLVCAAVVVGWQALAPRAGATRSVSVAARDLPAGHRVTAGDLTATDWPTSAAIPGVMTTQEAVGRVLTAPLHAGEPVTGSRVRSTRHWPGIPSGRVLLTVPVSSTALAAVLRPGDRVDVMARGTGTTLGDSLRVARVSTPDSGSSMLPDASAGASILVACTEAVASRIAHAMHAAGTGGGILLALHPGP